MDGHARGGGPGQYGTNNGGFPTTTTNDDDNPTPEEYMRMIMGGDDHDFPQMTHESPLMDDRSGDGFGGLRGGGGGGGGYHYARGGPELGRISNSSMPRKGTAAAEGMSPPRGTRNDHLDLSAMGGGPVSGMPPGVAVGTLYEAANHPHSPALAHHYAAAAAAATAASSSSPAGLYYQDHRGPAPAAAATTPIRNDDRSSSSLMGHHHHHQQEARSPMVNQVPSTRPGNFPCPQPGAPRGSTVQPAEPSLPRTRLGRRILTTKPQRQPDLVVAKFDQATTPSPSTMLLDCTDVECATCANRLQIPKSAVVVMCPICDQVNPVASCRVK